MRSAARGALLVTVAIIAATALVAGWGFAICTLVGVEVKATVNPGYNDSKGLRAFLQEYGDDALGGVLLHGGEKTLWMSERVLAVPWWKII